LRELLTTPTNKKSTKYKNPLASLDSIKRLAPGKWLNDEIINSYLSMISIHNNKIIGQGADIISTHYFSSFFVTNLLKNDGSHGSVLKKFNINKYSRLVFPINIKNEHWVFASADTNSLTIECYDPLGGENENNTTVLNAIINWLEVELPHSENSWNAILPKGLPKQKNGYDCGVFLLLYAHHTAFDGKK
jgi:sentrin-specific protease 1